ncbi:hypothetical protein [Paracoccus zeaxanthinifaciens]|uniref:hypothetical protein n=1 Tax=Paracoccus zeaxanthinifaciens TaxID=187400 RepID=UPI0003B60238|nr:hypothetical protein [Paracoccus zeaxanthinifaciens]
MRLLAERGLEWLRRHIMDLPDPCPADHPALPALAATGRLAPMLSALRGRPSPLESLVGRRLPPDLLRDAALRVTEGARDGTTLLLMQAGAPDTQPWRLACDQLASDTGLPLTDRLPFAKHDLLPKAERLLDRADAETSLTLMLHLWRFGTARPQLSDRWAVTRIHDRLQWLLQDASDRRDTTDLASTLVSLTLIDPGFDPGRHAADLIASQRSDGSFGARLGEGVLNQSLCDGATPTLAAIHALHAMGWRRGQPSVPTPHPGRAS